MNFLHLAVLLPLIVAALIPFTHKHLKQWHLGWLVLVVPFGLFCYFLSFLSRDLTSQPLVYLMKWIPDLGINYVLRVDGLSLLFVLLITGIGALVTLYSIFYLSKKKEQLHYFYAYLLIFMTAMLGLVLSDNMMVLYLFWEMTSISSFLLIGYWHKRERSRYGAKKALYITVFGGLMMLGGMSILSNLAGSFSIQTVIAEASTFSNSPFFMLAMIFILLGAFTKSAQFPFHIWLPDAMEAPTPISAYLHSATMVKAGIYLVARMTPVFAPTHQSWSVIIMIVGLTTLFWGSFNALKQVDLKGILAYSTISQLGLIMSLLGLGSNSLREANGFYVAALAAALLHLFNHATFKGALFMVVGIIDHETGTRDIRRLGGLMNVMPLAATLAFVGTFAMAGIPPFNGFVSKEMFLESFVNLSTIQAPSLTVLSYIFLFVAWIASVITFVYSMILFFRPFTGKMKPWLQPKKATHTPIGMATSPLILVIIVVVSGLFPNLLATPLITPAIHSVKTTLNSDYQLHLSLWHGFTPALWLTIAIIIIGSILAATYLKWKPLIQRPLRFLFSWNDVYNRGNYYFEKLSYRSMTSVMNGNLRFYLIILFMTFIFATIIGVTTTSSLNFSTAKLSPIDVVDWLIFAAAVVVLLAIMLSKARLTSVILLGALGYLIAIIFMIARAPDLALTQLVVETISVILYLLAFRFLPQIGKDEEKITPFSWRLWISMAVGFVMFIVVFSSFNTTFFDSVLSPYFIENAYTKGGGKNVVNVTLVDFRGFDTFFESAVLTVAAMSIYSLIRLRLNKGDKQHEE
ncbi:Na+/H+ antiporter subunit A [Brochothrix thermosphacta]|uniref:Sodium transporter component of a Na+/H+ antiporter n=1 Tax=Brochothrix thermosphacta TaxID=2756 RepID=A0A2X0QIT3_BROTH|nr:Na+/H+ antiporter subunit A [Brochothrix thermosphacta]SPP28509.1 sodium transporter component of a Na+/H+ antiporter [Brochothrix thermosphacta]